MSFTRRNTQALCLWFGTNTHLARLPQEVGAGLTFLLIFPKDEKNRVFSDKKTNSRYRRVIMQEAGSDEERQIAAANSSSPQRWQSDGLQTRHLARKHTPARNRSKRQRLNKHDSRKESGSCAALGGGLVPRQPVELQPREQVGGGGSPGENRSSRRWLASLNRVRTSPRV